MFGRAAELLEIGGLLQTRAVVAILGPRQIGKTTLARELARTWPGAATTFDLEDPRDVARLDDPITALGPLRGLVVIDEIQRRPDLFPVLRVLADRGRSPARFLLLGSASPGLLRQSSESLAGRIAYVELPGFGLADVGARWPRLWLRGGYPRPYLARTDEDSLRWRRDLIRTYVEQDLPQLGITIGAGTLHRFWTMLAHYHAQIWNGAELARAFGIAESTVKRYLDLLVNTFMVRVLPPWSENIGKRVVKTPRVYIADPGLLHALLDIPGAGRSAVTPRSAPRSRDSRCRRSSGPSGRDPSSATSGRPIRAPSSICWWCRDAGAGDSSSSARMPLRPPSRCTSRSTICPSTRST